MPLHDFTYGQPQLVKPKKAERADWVQAYLRKEHKRTSDRVVQTLDELLDVAVAEGLINGKLIWTKTGKLLGFKSMGPKARVDHAWDSVVAVMGTDRPCIFTMGQLLKWRISLRSEPWGMKRDETGATDPLTGDPILAAEYFVLGKPVK